MGWQLSLIHISYTQGSKEDGEKDAIDCLMEDMVSRTHRHREYYNNYQRYQLIQVDRERVIMACNIIILSLIHIYGTPCAVKVACTVWSGGKARDDIRGLPITIEQ